MAITIWSVFQVVAGSLCDYRKNTKAQWVKLGFSIFHFLRRLKLNLKMGWQSRLGTIISISTFLPHSFHF
jgi:hypothetical protein